MRKIAFLMVSAALLATVKAEVIYSDDFQGYAVANPAGADFLTNWTVAGPGGTNSSRIFQTNNFGGTKLWISLVDGTSITSNGIAISGNNAYRFSAMLASETSDGTRKLNATYDLLVGPTAAEATSIIGGPVTVVTAGDNYMIPASKADHIFTQDFTTQTLNPDDKLFIKITLVGVNSGSKPFFCVDDVKVLRMAEPDLVSPANGASNQAVDVQLSWEAPEAYTPLGYNVYVATSEPNLTASRANRYSPAQTDLTYVPVPALARGITYYWRVEALEPNTVAPYTPIAHSSPVWSFTTLPANVVITGHPLGKTVPAGAALNLTVEALNGQTYQWYKDNTLLTGQTSPLLTLTNVQLADEGFYYCVVSNSLPSTATSAAAHVMIRRLVAHWPLNGNLEAIESNPAENWDGVYMNVAEPPASPSVSTEPVVYIPGADGTANGAVRFSGGRVVEIPDSNDFFNFHPQGLTLTAWVLGPTGGDWRRFVNKNGSYAGCQHNSNTIQMILDGGSGWQTAVPANEAGEGKWRFVAMTYDPQTKERVIYGAYDDQDTFDILHVSSAAQTATASGTLNLIIGGASVTQSYYNYLGSVDDVRIYNYPLSPDQIAEVYREMKGGWICMKIPAMDTTGPEGVSDCQVNLYEIAAYAETWLECGRYPESLCP